MGISAFVNCCFDNTCTWLQQLGVIMQLRAMQIDGITQIKQGKTRTMVHHAISCMVSHSDLLLRLPEGAVECKACEEIQKYLDIRLTKFQWAFNVKITRTNKNQTLYNVRDSDYLWMMLSLFGGVISYEIHKRLTCRFTKD